MDYKDYVINNFGFRQDNTEGYTDEQLIIQDVKLLNEIEQQRIDDEDDVWGYFAINL